MMMFVAPAGFAIGPADQRGGNGCGLSGMRATDAGGGALCADEATTASTAAVQATTTRQDGFMAELRWLGDIRKNRSARRKRPRAVRFLP